MAGSKILNRQKLKASLQRLPERVRQALEIQVAQEAADLAAAVKRAVPVDTGTLRDTVRVERDGDVFSIAVGGPATTKKVRSRKVAAGRKKTIGVSDADFARALLTGGNRGEFDYARGVEFGHRTASGAHVAARPFLFPTYRARKKAIRRRVKAAARKAVKQLFPG